MGKVFMIIRELSNLNRKSGKAKALMIILPVLTVLASVFMIINSYSENISSGLAENLIRLHVIANSDSPEDQTLKGKVRDAVLEYVHNEIKESKSIQQTISIINEKMNGITAVAENVILKNGKSYGIRTSIGSYPFPTKVYGDITLPAGNYQALRLIIGNGEGANWWCVLFPPLCFVDVTHGTVPDSVKDDLKEVLSDEEYKIIASAEEEADIPIKIKFKIVEFFENSKIKFANAINRLFSSPG